MTKKELAQYRSICDEIAELTAAIKDNTEHSTVRGSDAEFPYLSHSMKVSGLQSTEDNKNTLTRVRKLKSKKREIEKFIDNIDDSLTRRIFKQKYIKGKNWVQVAMSVGGDNTPDGVRMTVNRYLQKN